ncbi:hypothetical protein [Citrobacter werkmanii]|uniref:hypothetical protein n=1 Tax=Citrobacter werkmanii TaxID=67827 RepID=UPI00388F64F5
MTVYFDFDRDVVIHEYHQVSKYYISSSIYRQMKGTGLPANSTEVPPPDENAPNGMVYIFNDNTWDLVQDTFPRPNIEEVNYTYTGERPLETVIERIDFPFTYFPQYNDVVDYISSNLKTLHLSFNYVRIQKKYLYIIELFNLATSTHNPFTLQERIFDYKVESEFFVAMIRSFFDEMVQLTYLLINEVSDNLIDSIGSLIRDQNKNRECYNVFFGDNDVYIKDDSEYLVIINNLSNSIKHSSLHYESYSSYPLSPNILSFYKKNNTFKNNDVVIHNHNVVDVFLGFKANFHRIIKNQQNYVKHHAK